MIYITGDIHGDVRRVEQFCYEKQTTNKDMLIMIGDVGVNFDSNIGDQMKKELLSMMPITLFGIHGNHEQRHSNIPTYHEAIWNGGIVYVEDEFPNILLVKDGEIFDIDGAKTIVILRQVVISIFELFDLLGIEDMYLSAKGCKSGIFP